MRLGVGRILEVDAGGFIVGKYLREGDLSWIWCGCVVLIHYE